MGDEKKSPKEVAIKEVNKMLGSAIAERLIKIKKLQAEIKEVEKEIEKINKGEYVPEIEVKTENKYKPFTSLSNCSSYTTR